MKWLLLSWALSGMAWADAPKGIQMFPLDLDGTRVPGAKTFHWEKARCELRNEALVVVLEGKSFAEGKVTLTVHDYTRYGDDFEIVIEDQYKIGWTVDPSRHARSGCELTLDNRAYDAGALKRITIGMKCLNLVPTNPRGTFVKGYEIPMISCVL